MNLHNIYGQLCRICMCKSSKYFNLKKKISLNVEDGDEVEMTLQDMLEQIVPTVVPSEKIVLPQEICQTCMEQLEMLYKFYKMYLNTNQRLIKMWEETQGDKLFKPTTVHLSCSLRANAHEDIKSFSCVICSTKLTTRYMLMKHIGQHHQPKIILEKLLPNIKENEFHIKSIRITDNLQKETSNGLQEYHVLGEYADTKDNAAIELRNDNDITKPPHEHILPEIVPLIHNNTEYTKKYDNKYKTKKANTKQKINEKLKKTVLFACPQCPATFTTLTELRKHKKQHSSMYRYLCFICNDRFKYPHLVQEHQVRRHGLQCDIKKKTNDKETKIKSHVKKYQCDFCEMAYTSVGALAQHMSKRHPTLQPYPCEKCNQAFVVEEHLRIHMDRHNGIKSFKCNQCEKSFTYKSSMKQHMRLHTGQVNYLCSLCGKTFHRPSNFIQHMQRHGNETPYSCPHCPKRFKCQSDRYIHMMTHNEGKVYKCPICDKRFSRLDTLQQHKILHTGLKRYKCNQCPRSFASADNCNRHKRTHTGEKPYICEYCERSYCQRNDLVKHWRTHLGEKVYRCKQCQEAFKFNVELKKHELQHYQKEMQQNTVCL